MDGSSFLVMWSSDRIRSLRTSGWVHRPLPYLFGGPHISHPSPTKAGVSDGDSIFPVGIKGGRLMVLCECVVGDVMPIYRFYGIHRVPLKGGWQSGDLRDWLGERSCAWLAPTCTDDAIVLRSATPLAVDRFVPLDQMHAVRMLNKRGERPLKHLLPDGRLKNTMTIHGSYYRLAPATAALFASVARGCAVESAREHPDGLPPLEREDRADAQQPS